MLQKTRIPGCYSVGFVSEILATSAFVFEAATSSAFLYQFGLFRHISNVE
jgi:hypothetical protein